MAFRYLLDTNVLSEVMRRDPNPGVLERMLNVGSAAVTAAPVWHELDFGRLSLPASRRRRAIDSILDDFERVLVILPYDAKAARWHAQERARLSRRGKPPAFVDGQIAAVAAVNGLTLVTRNVRHFSAFSELAVESWFS